MTEVTPPATCAVEFSEVNAEGRSLDDTQAQGWASFIRKYKRPDTMAFEVIGRTDYCPDDRRRLP